MHMYLEVSQVRSHLNICVASSGSWNSTYARGITRSVSDTRATLRRKARGGAICSAPRRCCLLRSASRVRRPEILLFPRRPQASPAARRCYLLRSASRVRRPEILLFPRRPQGSPAALLRRALSSLQSSIGGGRNPLQRGCSHAASSACPHRRRCCLLRSASRVRRPEILLFPRRPQASPAARRCYLL